MPFIDPLRTLRRALTVAAVIATTLLRLHAQTFTVSGAVRDANSKELLPGATVRVAGTSAGTITNKKGRYKLALPRGPAELTAGYMGYASQRVKLAVDSSIVFDFALVPSPVQLGSTTVYAKNAEAIIRRAIAEKQKTLAALHSYQFDAYTKSTVLADKGRVTAGSGSITIGTDSDSPKHGDTLAVQTVLESFSTGYWREGDGLREIVRQRRQTANIPQENNLNAVFILYNFNDDEQRLGRYVLTGPTAPSALDVYSYELLDVTSMHGRKVYRLRMTPKSDGTALWDGIVSIADSTWNVVEVDVRPNAVVNFPFIDSVRYSQTFVPIDSTYWMPSNIVATAAISLNVLFVKARLRLEHASVLSNYVINPVIPDSVFEQQRVIADSAANAFDSSYWRTHEVMPLTADEQSAYVTIDSMVKADTVRPGWFASLLGGFASLPERLSLPPFTGFSDFYHFDRVEGNTLGVGVDMPWHTWLPDVSLDAKYAYGFSDKRAKGELSLLWAAPVSKSIVITPRVNVYHTVRWRPDADFYSTGDNTFLGLLEKTDYRNYYYAEGFTAGVRIAKRLWWGEIGVVDERHTSARKNTDFSIITPSQRFPENSPSWDGRLIALQLRGHVGVSDPTTRPTTAAALTWETELTPRAASGAAFDFVRHEAFVLAHLRTSSFGFLDLRASAGLSTGSLPPQRMFEIESNAGGFATFGVFRATHGREFGGDRYASVLADQNLGDGVFRTFGRWFGSPYLAYSGMEIIMEAGAAWTDFSQTGLAAYGHSARLPYAEVGFGINRILSLFRLDFSWRLTHRFESGNARVTITAARL